MFKTPSRKVNSSGEHSQARLPQILAWTALAVLSPLFKNFPPDFVRVTKKTRRPGAVASSWICQEV